MHATDLSQLLHAAEHDYCRHSLIHYHLPEVSNSVLQWTLSYNESPLLTVALEQWLP